jgi:hypothetical protein
LPEVNPVVEDGVRAAARREHVDGLENAHEDRTAILLVQSSHRCNHVHSNVQVSQIENANDIEPEPEFHLETPDDGDGQGSQDHVGEDVAGWARLDQL